jgi:hypothetical protein
MTERAKYLFSRKQTHGAEAYSWLSLYIPLLFSLDHFIGVVYLNFEESCGLTFQYHP